MNHNCCECSADQGPCLSVINTGLEACKNQHFRKAVWTGSYLQMTLMSIPPCGEIGEEIHEDTDQLLRIEHGEAVLILGQERCKDAQKRCLKAGDSVFVPAGTWHNVRNTGCGALKVSSVYAPPHHPWGTLQR